MSSRTRIAAASLALSAAGFVGIMASEGWTDRAVVPVQGDRWTVGPGLTMREDGTPVQPGDTVTPPEGIRRSLAHIQADEHGLRRCVTAPLYQVEYDLLVDHAYQYGSARTCASSIVRRANAGDYRGSCEAYTSWRFAGGYDCSTLIDGKPNRRCWGVWTRSMERRDRCLEAQQ